MTNNDDLITEVYFGSPIYTINKPEWLNQTNKVCDDYIREAYNIESPRMKERKQILNEKDLAKVKDHGLSYHSLPLTNNPELKDLQEFIGNTAWNIMDSQGFDMSQYTIFFKEFWVQEFSKNGGGYHDTHIHSDSHISGFYFLKCSDKTSYPLFHDPRPGALMTKLILKDDSQISLGQDLVNYKPKPGTMIFFNSYLPHQYIVDDGIEPFRFIHFNLHAVRNEIVKSSYPDLDLG